jgi:hypothetical protein
MSTQGGFGGFGSNMQGGYGGGYQMPAYAQNYMGNMNNPSTYYNGPMQGGFGGFNNQMQPAQGNYNTPPTQLSGMAGLPTLIPQRVV